MLVHETLVWSISRMVSALPPVETYAFDVAGGWPWPVLVVPRLGGRPRAGVAGAPEDVADDGHVDVGGGEVQRARRWRIGARTPGSTRWHRTGRLAELGDNWLDA